MTTTNRDFTIPAGGTLQFVVDVIDGPADLTGYVGSMQIRELRTSEEVLAEVPPGAIVVNPGARQVTVTIPSSETSLYTWRRGVYDLLLTGPGSDSWRLVEGRVINSLAVTRED